MVKKAGEHINLFIVEDNRFMREGWTAILNLESDFIVLDAFESCEEAFESDVLPKADIAIMDIELPGMSGIEGVTYIREKHPGMAVIMATAFDDDKNVFEALCAGAVGYLMKKISPGDLKQAVRDASDGGSPMSPGVARKVIQAFHLPSGKDGRGVLTERELEILEQLAKGRSYAAIGETLFLSVDGVRYHIRNIYDKLQVNTRAEAVSKGISHRLIKPLMLQ